MPLDNNRTETALRGLVTGRKNHHDSRSRRGSDVAALLYSLVETALLNDVDPADYIYTAAILAIEFGEALLPWEFATLPDAALRSGGCQTELWLPAWAGRVRTIDRHPTLHRSTARNHITGCWTSAAIPPKNDAFRHLDEGHPRA